jgi:NAD(P)H-hydrate epimerase
MNYITHEEMQKIDMNSAFFGVSRLELMENAGRKVAEVLNSKFVLKNKKIAVLCGTGNNGGDGFVAARILSEKGADVEVFLAGDVKSDEAKKNLELLCKKGIKISKKIEIDADIVVDALLGTGIKGELKEPIKSIVDKINACRGFKVSVDVPSGLDLNGKGYCVNPNLVITFHKMKKGLEKFNTVIEDIGIPPEAETHVGPGDLIYNLKERKQDSHKGDNGRLLVIGGSDVYHGAPILASMAAINSGSDLVYVAVPEINYTITKISSPDFIVAKYPGDFLSLNAVDTVLQLAENCDAIVIGPGLGTRNETKDAILEILEKIKIPAVVDADGIKALAGRRIRNCVLTPHKGEFKILTGVELPKNIEGMEKSVLKFSAEISSTILLKSSVDIIASPDGRSKLNSTGNPGMTVGGSGDVLSGIVGSFISQGLELFEAACCAAFVNGCAGDALYERKGYYFTASDLAQEIPYVIKDMLEFA